VRQSSVRRNRGISVADLVVTPAVEAVVHMLDLLDAVDSEGHLDHEPPPAAGLAIGCLLAILSPQSSTGILVADASRWRWPSAVAIESTAGEQWLPPPAELIDYLTGLRRRGASLAVCFEGPSRSSDKARSPSYPRAVPGGAGAPRRPLCATAGRQYPTATRSRRSNIGAAAHPASWFEGARDAHARARE